MKSEYKFIITVEVDAATDEEEHKLLKEFKRELFRQYAYMDKPVMITGIKRR